MLTRTSLLIRQLLIYVLSDCRCNGSSTETSVLVAITGLGSTPPEEGITGGGTQATPHSVSTSRSENPLTYSAASHLRTRR
ncbi:hypothetical protein AVEN_65346-1 [Araneus ventricosus]|uniref:Secreted protein n=1 Tax=Araneus ventricosus TaxID=182803 RepID=A0A4Y2AIP9_ARAVE|nr:hypothetical protein AVEN_65346-1 [Araneus ventricosus]